MSIHPKTQPYKKILQLLPRLSAEEQLGLISKIILNLRKNLSTKLKPVNHTSVVTTVKGKYANIGTSSERFAQRKQEEIELEK